jgi:hypothetical protein
MNYDLSIVTIENAFHQLGKSSSFKKYFSDMLSVRSESYAHDFGVNFNPFDGSDFVCRHHIFYFQNIPIAAHKTVASQVCINLGIDFPIFRFYNDKCEKHVMFIKELIDKNIKSKKTLFYAGSWGVIPKYRTHRIHYHLMELLGATIADEHFKNNKAELVGVGRAPKTIKFWEKIGFDKLKLDLPELPHPGNEQDKIELRVMNEPSSFSINALKKYHSIINDRIIIS